MLAAGAAVLEAAQEAQAYGLAAAHLGLDEPLVVVSIINDTKQRDYQILYNPRIAEFTGDAVPGVEGSVSMPGIEVSITRPTEVLVAYQDDQGVSQIRRLAGFAARIALHEIDQMKGIFFLERLSRVKRDMAMRRFRKLEQ